MQPDSTDISELFNKVGNKHDLTPIYQVEKATPVEEKDPDLNLLLELTPKSTKKEIDLIKEELRKLRERKSPPRADPRVFNHPLPNQSTMTYKFGSRSYISDVYPGYTWYNGHWYKITEDLKFTESRGLQYTHIHGSTMLHKQYIDTTVQINESFYPIIYNGTRLFVKRHLTENYVYIPHLQGVVQATGSLSELRFVSAEYDHNGVVFEDIDFMVKHYSARW